MIDEKDKILKNTTAQLTIMKNNLSVIEDKYVALKSEQLKARIQINSVSPEHNKMLENKIKLQSKLIDKLLQTDALSIITTKKAFKFLDPISIHLYSVINRALRNHTAKKLSSSKYWKQLSTYGFNLQRSNYYLLYFHYFLSKQKYNMDQPDNNKQIEKSENDFSCFDIEINPFNVSSFINGELSPTAFNADKSSQYIQTSKCLIKEYGVADYWLYKHGLCYVIENLWKCSDGNQYKIAKIANELKKPPYQLDKLYSEDYYMVNLIVFQITHLLKEKLCELYYFFKKVDFQLNKMLINWVVSMFSDKVLSSIVSYSLTSEPNL